MEDKELIDSILHDIEIAVLKRVGPEKYVPIGEIPSFYRELYPDDENGPCSAPWKYSDMLAFFLEDAEHFFSEDKEGRHTSSVWQEEGVDRDKALFAQALATSKGKAIIVRCFREEYVERVRILQKARETLLEKRGLKRDLELYKNISRHDKLTSLNNQASFKEILEAEIANTRNTGAYLSLLMMDIDNFKLINDTYGHLAGDEVLASIGKILQSGLRGGDIAARYGGEEFAVLATDTTQTQVFHMAENIRKRIDSYDFPEAKHVTVSIGCTTYQPPEEINEFIQRADFALYDAKRNNKNNVKIR
ncbi:MAG: GGDEF domain-containing protein [Acidobacteriota bacterium]|jgi:diguanylate cyclase (GGDEF)-like protein|nr:GGDEF domain-containing protein [Acidobacteriota bacterium]